MACWLEFQVAFAYRSDVCVTVLSLYAHAIFSVRLLVLIRNADRAQKLHSASEDKTVTAALVCSDISLSQ